MLWLIPAYVVLGLVVAGVGVHRGWGPYTASEHHPQFFLILLTWPLFVLCMGAWQVGTWVIDIATKETS